MKDAQRLGYAEANPSLDIDGFDTAHKACILSALAYGFQPQFDQVQVEGIRGLSGMDVKFAADLGYRIKLLAVVAKEGDEVEVGVHPTPGEPGMQPRDPCLPWRGILGPGHTPR